MSSESVLNKNMEYLESNLSSILSNKSFENQDDLLETNLLHDNPANKRNIMKKKCGVDSGTFTNSNVVKKKNFNFNQENGDAMTHTAHFNLNNQKSLSNVKEYDHDHWYHFTGNNIVQKNDFDFNVKKMIKNRIHSNKPRLSKTPIKPRMSVESYLKLNDPPLTIDMKQTGILQRSKLQNISDCELMQIAVKDWSFFLSKLCNDRKVFERDFFHYHGNDKENVDFLVMNRSKSLELTIAFMINETIEESVHGSNLLLFIHEYCKDQGILFEESRDDYWRDVEDILKKISDPQFGITSAVVMRNMMNYKRNFNNKVVGEMWMDSLNKLIDGIKVLVTYLWILQVKIKSGNKDSKVQ